MESMKNEHSTTEIAETLEVSASGYAEHLKKHARPRRRKDQDPGETLTAIFKENRKTYGAPRLQISLRKQGIRCGKSRSARLQRQFGLRPVQKRRFRPRTTPSDPRLPVAEKELAKVPTPIDPNKSGLGIFDGFADLWAACGSLSPLRSGSYIETQEGWLYLAGILDLYSPQSGGMEHLGFTGCGVGNGSLKEGMGKAPPGPRVAAPLGSRMSVCKQGV